MANWFAYTGSGNPFLAGSYSRLVIKPTCISGGCTVCAIYLDDNSTGAPSSIDGNVLAYITSTMGTLVAQPKEGKRFVYVKSCS